MILIFGKKGTGKTTLAKKLVSVHKKNLIILDVNNEYQEYGEIYNNLPDFLQAIRKNEFPIRYFSDETESFFSLLYYFRNITLLIDELHIFTSPYGFSSSLLKLVRLQRHINLKIYGVSQRIAEVSRTITAQKDKIITFRQEEPRDLKILEEYGFDPEEVKNLKKFQYLEVLA